MGMVVRRADLADIQAIHDVALDTWEPTYRPIISQEQIQIMFEDLLSLAAIERQIKQNEGTYVLAIVDGLAQGFAYFAPKDGEGGRHYKLHRLYVRPSTQHHGVGGAILRFVEDELSQQGVLELELNVNRYNTAQEFYRKQGYQVCETVDIPYKHYWLNDYVMKKALR